MYIGETNRQGFVSESISILEVNEVHNRQKSATDFLVSSNSQLNLKKCK